MFCVLLIKNALYGQCFELISMFSLSVGGEHNKKSTKSLFCVLPHTIDCLEGRNQLSIKEE